MESKNLKKGQKVKISEENDNDNYDLFRNQTLIITHASVGGRWYDDTMYPQKLLDLETEIGESVPFSLYEYEVDPI